MSSSALDIDDVIARIRRAVQTDDSLVLHEPRFAGREWEYVKDCLDTGWVSSVGSYVDRFEKMIAEACDAQFGVAVVNGTAALHIALLLSGVSRDDEVLMPSLTFIATANAVSYLGAVPHFIDVDSTTLGVSPDALKDHLADVAERREGRTYNRQTGRPITAIVPMHTFGAPVDMDRLVDVAGAFGIGVVEDAAESLGSRYKDRATGTLAAIGAVSFNGNKIVTTGGGGAIVTNDPVLAKRAKHLTTQAKKPHRWSFEHDEIGFNYRLPNINAAIGCAQLEQLPGFMADKRRLAERYQAAFAGASGLSLFREPPDMQSNCWLNALILDVSEADRRDELLAATNDVGIMTRPVWTLMSRLPMFAHCPRAPLPVAESLERRIVNVPSSAKLGDGS